MSMYARRGYAIPRDAGDDSQAPPLSGEERDTVRKISDRGRHPTSQSSHGDGDLVPDLTVLLKRRGIHLMPDVTHENFLRRLHGALHQVDGMESQSEEAEVQRKISTGPRKGSMHSSP